MLRQIRALETTDEGPDGGHVAPVPRSLPRRPRRPRTGSERRRTLTTLGVTGAIVGGMLMLNVAPGSYQIRSLLGIDDRLGTEVDPRTTGAYAFLATRRGSTKPIGWSPCEPIGYVVNPEGAPDDWDDLVHDAVETVSEATGLVFEDEGVTDDREFESRFGPGDSIRPVLIGWATEDEVPGLEGDVAGLAGPISRSVGVLQSYVTGRVVFDADAFEEIDSYANADAQHRAIVLHELGHLVGLDHVDDPRELMYRTTEATEFGPGDLRGLARLGNTPCGGG